MKNFNLIRHLRQSGLKSVNSGLARTKNPWDPIKLHPYNHQDEHAEPKEEEIIREIFDRDYYHFGFKAASDQHHDKDMFDYYRQWQHLYIHPKEPFLGWVHGSPILKYLYFFMPLLIILFYYKGLPVSYIF